MGQGQHTHTLNPHLETGHTWRQVFFAPHGHKTLCMTILHVWKYWLHLNTFHGGAHSEKHTRGCIYKPQRDINRHITKIKLLFITKCFLSSFFISFKFPTEFLFWSSQQPYFSSYSKTLKLFKIIKVQTQFLSTYFSCLICLKNGMTKRHRNQM